MDVERGRTVQKWLPARLGGGLGKTRSIGANKRVQRSYVYCFDYINHRLIEKKERDDRRRDYEEPRMAEPKTYIQY